MSMSLASFYRLAVFHPFEIVRRRLQARPVSAAAEHLRRDDPERLERIAAYARAGYFNVGSTLEMSHLIGEIAPD